MWHYIELDISPAAVEIWAALLLAETLEFLASYSRFHDLYGGLE